MAAMRRFHQKLLRCLISPASTRITLRFLQPHSSPSPSPFYYNTNFSQTFHRTLSALSQFPPHSTNFPQFQSSSPQSQYDPIDFHALDGKISQNNVLGTVELVELVQKTKSFASKKEAIDFITASYINTDANQVYFAIWALRNDWELCLLVLELNEKWGFVNEKILGLIVWVLGSHHKFDIAWKLIRDFHSVVDTRRTMLVIIERYAAANCHEKAIKTFDFMEKLSVSPDQNSLYSLVSALCKHGNVEEAEEFMLKNKKLFPLETEGFNIILHAWCTICIDLLEAKRVWREMASNCITPDAISYTHMIFCHSRVGSLFDSLRLYDEMKKRGWVPGLDVYNSLMYAMTRENCPSEALKLFDKIKELGLQPDSLSYSCLICPLCETGKFEDARALLVSMSRDGIKPTLETYKAFLTDGDLDSTLDILRKMKNDKVGPDSGTFLVIFDRFFNLRQPENVLKVWVEMQYFGVHPEATHYSSLIRGLANCGCLNKAKEMHTEMISNGFVDDPQLKKLLQGLERVSHQGKVGSTPASYAGKLNPPSASRITPHRGTKKRGSISLKKKQTVD
ncbi:pentatricopeptide repeat-containing protein At1g80880, mitochondrial [Silene latifolia]|uniref:pentatricopeptide repeat-containing protein At1g80880, mitochondrial n=1 Tax=Silene latifolia TaxID=37657 RepID=UPI003D77900E